MLKRKDLKGIGKLTKSEFDFILGFIPKSGIFLEVGTHDGVSARMLADKRPDVIFVAIDPFPLGSKNLTEDGPYNWWKNRGKNQYMFSGDLKDFINFSKQIFVDVIFIDGCHEYEYVISDLNIGWKLLKNKGILLGHDFGHSGVHRAVLEFSNNNKIAVEKNYKDTVYLFRKDEGE